MSKSYLSAPGSSTGPKTDEGKAVSSRNALSHGILANYKTDFDQINPEAVYLSLVEEYGDGGPTKRFLIAELAKTFVKLQRCARAEVEILKEAMNPRITRTESPLDLPKIEREVVIAEGEPATLSIESLGRLSLVYERYEPRLVNRALKLIQAIKDLG